MSNIPNRTAASSSSGPEASTSHAQQAATDGIVRIRKSTNKASNISRNPPVSSPTFRVPAVPVYALKSTNQATPQTVIASNQSGGRPSTSASTSVSSKSTGTGSTRSPVLVRKTGAAVQATTPSASHARFVPEKFANASASTSASAFASGSRHTQQRPRLSATLVSSKKTSPTNIRSTSSKNAVITASPSGAGVAARSTTLISTTTTTSTHTQPPAKQYKRLGPLWQQLDDEVEQRMLLQKRDRSGNMVGFARRAAASRRDATVSWGGGGEGNRRARGGGGGRGGGRGGGGGGGGDGGMRDNMLDVDDPDRVTAQIAPRLRLRVGGEVVVDDLSEEEEQEQDGDEDEDDEEEEERYRPQARRTAIKSQGGAGPLKNLATRSSARKNQSVDTSSSSSTSSSEDSESEKSEELSKRSPSVSGSGIEDEDDEDELDPDQYEPHPHSHGDRDGDVLMRDASEEIEIISFDEQMMITAPLPVPIKTEDLDEDSAFHGQDSDEEGYRPSDALISSIEALSLSTTRMRATRQLPFLRRSVRRGFLERCRGLYVPIYSESRNDDDNTARRRKMRMQVVYETPGGGVYRAGVDEWACPICDLFQRGESEEGSGFETREMLDRHLRWDHAQVYYEWVPGAAAPAVGEEDENETYEWLLQLVIPEPEPEPEPVLPISAAGSASAARAGEDTHDASVHANEHTGQTPKRGGRATLSPAQTPDARHYHEDSGIFPSVSMSPPSARRPSIVPSPSPLPQPRPQPEHQQKVATTTSPTAKRPTARKTLPAGVPTMMPPISTANKMAHAAKRERVKSSVAHERGDYDMVGASRAGIRDSESASVTRDSASASRDSSSASRYSVTASGSEYRDSTSRSHSITGTTPGTPTGNIKSAGIGATSAKTAAVAASTSRPAQPRPRSPTARYPTPPPADAPLGPAARYPYLPAFPSHLGDGGGPADTNITAVPGHAGETVSYSCRPGPGPYLFDLLGTLPLAEYGVLDWEVVDREDEIWESDDVKEEYKVMHALWARWVFVAANRNKFVANYVKGVIAFVDTYWRIIHKAAGWSALRYFLFIFLANQFLNGREVAQVLTHYEELIGMANWYE